MSYRNVFDFDKSRPRPTSPLRTTEEMAVEFGVTLAFLSGCIGKDPNAPKSWSRRGNCYTGRRTYWESEKVRQWWAARRAKESA